MGMRVASVNSQNVEHEEKEKGFGLGVGRYIYPTAGWVPPSRSTLVFTLRASQIDPGAGEINLAGQIDPGVYQVGQQGR
jgi:hypothetical protein